MISLNTSPIAPLIDRLFAEADATRPALRALAASMPEADHARLLGSKTEYLDVYTRMKDLPLPVSRETGTLLYMLARALGARSIVEFGTSIGISTIYLAAALRDNGGGRVITTEFEPSKIARAIANLEAAALTDLVEIRAGDALESLARDLPDTIDLVLLDGAKGLYGDILDRLAPHLRIGAVIVADNVDMAPDYLSRIRADDSGYLSAPFGGDVELTVRVG